MRQQITLTVRTATFLACLMLTGCAFFGASDVNRSAPVAAPEVAPPPPRPVLESAPVPPRTTAVPSPAQPVYEGSYDPIPLTDRHPQRYTVVRGDTLWDISSLFLKDPWLWPEIWAVNNQIANPHLIYPGDVLSLIYVNGQPQLRLDRGGSQSARLSPEVRIEGLDQAVTAIPYDAIAPFLSRPTVLTKDQINNAPYIVAMKNRHLVAGEGFEAYVRGADLPNGGSYSLLHVGDEYIDPETNKVIGFEALYVGQARVIATGDPATIKLTDSRREVLEGDLLLPVEPDIPLFFYPQAPDRDIEGHIVDVVDGVDLIGQYQIAVLNRGAKDGLAQGHVLEVFLAGEVIRDRYDRSLFFKDKVKLPDVFAGRMMVFRVLDEISYALVMSAENEIHVADIVRSP